MFSGIIQATGTVERTAERGAVRVVRVQRPRGWKLATGQSIAIDGICSTAARLGTGYFEVEYMPETLRKTTAGNFVPGTLLNLERSLTLQQYVDGHLVMGHVDARGAVTAVHREKNVSLVTIAVPRELAPVLALHGSVAINGVSLTIARKAAKTITVSLIPHTLAATNLGTLAKGSLVNIEVDMMARYVFAALGKGSTMPLHAKKGATKKSR